LIDEEGDVTWWNFVGKVLNAAIKDRVVVARYDVSDDWKKLRKLGLSVLRTSGS
tara:strand:- start:188 stop:349 length:162 start_codon:yes stop_codon:yes gene_type:complete